MEFYEGEYLLVWSRVKKDGPQWTHNLIISDMKLMGQAPIRAYATLEEAQAAQKDMIRQFAYDVAIVQVVGKKEQI